MKYKRLCLSPSLYIPARNWTGALVDSAVCEAYHSTDLQYNNYTITINSNSLISNSININTLVCVWVWLCVYVYCMCACVLYIRMLRIYIVLIDEKEKLVNKESEMHKIAWNVMHKGFFSKHKLLREQKQYKYVLLAMCWNIWNL